MANKIIAIDIDNTVSDTLEIWMQFTEIGLKEKGIIPERKPGIFSNTTAYGIERGSELYNYLKKRSQELNKTNWKDYKLIEFAKENLIKLKNQGFKLVFLSARQDSYFGDAKLITQNWLNYYEIPYDEIICNCEDKGSMCKEMKADFLVDDGLQYCEMAVQNGVKAIYFDNEQKELKQSGENKNPNITVCKNWNQIYNTLLKGEKWKI